MSTNDTPVQADPGANELSLFLASTAHDMKNSLGMLSGTLEKMLDGGAGQFDAPQLGHMLYQTRRLNDNLMHLLALYKQVGDGAYPFDLQPLAVAHLAVQVALGARALLAARAITLDTEVDPALVWHLDEDLIIGVLSHAINNAVNYTKDRISLRIGMVDGALELRVEDNGAGYPASMLAAGRSAPRAINFRTNSTGLGLYFSSKVAQMHKHRQRSGSLRLENGGTLGGGCFILTLP
ncbi:sensor histidine kinase [Massilia sp. DWR3-1-1]|uniref:sensor histidine kinase n=1 Tax=Massilia sp. DWR3-1-1 TaxID=2804559 RepID=UPI003CEE9785